MTKWGAVGTASLNISTVYVCLACSSSSASASHNTLANNKDKWIKHNKTGARCRAEAMVNLRGWTVSLLVWKDWLSRSTPLWQPPTDLDGILEDGDNCSCARACNHGAVQIYGGPHALCDSIRCDRFKQVPLYRELKPVRAYRLHGDATVYKCNKSESTVSTCPVRFSSFSKSKRVFNE